jgi:hypothetical protein
LEEHLDLVDARLSNFKGVWARNVALDDASWLRLATRAVELLSLELQRDLAIDPRQPPSLGKGFSVWTRELRAPGAADVSVRAIVGADLVAHGLLVRAWIFYYVGLRRVGPVLSAEEFPGAEYRKSPDVTAEFLNADLIVHADGRLGWQFANWDMGFGECEFIEFLRW